MNSNFFVVSVIISNNFVYYLGNPAVYPAGCYYMYIIDDNLSGLRFYSLIKEDIMNKFELRAHKEYSN